MIRKYIFTIVLFVITSGVVLATPQNLVRLTRKPENLVSASWSIKDFVEYTDTKKGYTILDNNPITAPVSAMAEDYFVVRAFSEDGTPINFSQTKLSRLVFLLVDEKTSNSGKYKTQVVMTYDVKTSLYSNKNFLVIPIKTAEMQLFLDANHKTLLALKFIDEQNNEISEFFIRRFDRFIQYSLDPLETRTIGLWVPYGLVGSNLNETEGGIGFTTAPIGIACGSKVQLLENFFIGFSLLGTWSITDTQQESENTNQTIFVKSAGTGLLLDFKSIFYLGFVYNWDLTLKGNDPGFYLLVGFGTDLLSYLAKGKP